MSDNEVQFPGNLPDSLAEADRNAPASSEHGVKWVHIWMLRGDAGNHALSASKAATPSEQQWHQRRERWCDEAANALEKFAPPFPEDEAEPVRFVQSGDVHGNGFRIV